MDRKAVSNGDDCPHLRARLQDRIRRSPHQRITFAEYMEIVLYDAEFGYYSGSQREIGKFGDYFTSSSLGADFAQLLARQFVQMWEILDRPDPFWIIEMGAGTGQVAIDLLEELENNYAACFASLRYGIVEKAGGLRALQQERLSSWKDKGAPIEWYEWEQLPDIHGCLFSNELVDAFPVHQVVRSSEELQEVYVGLDNRDNFIEILAELSTQKLQEYFENLEINLLAPVYTEGYRTEVNLAALDWIKEVAFKLKRGYLVTIDYGYSARRYYQPTRYTGTLQCYIRHHRHDNPYVNIGYQDITARVDFTTLENEGKRWGLGLLGLTQQALFLMSLGLGDRLAQLSHSSLPITQLLQRRDALHQLIDPLGLGGFQVLVQGKGLTEDEKQQILQGLKQFG
ncbi:class I SAM-dependent methyltransferase [Roseofilum casamattae]|uniref:Class I SAM-dependent methyltransferase n=1 Tax=Roseofilum casamattae BLCC-M143 TaxID=3022442 RepID=A0ABT7BUP0_9CYAN|nr:class I SAM-dependent methyltransferase [Roseofilum casamattae]MDJ1182810.1 class I SAM-dependent methyltransferase [Roseofilum casamattae BLCC-M143]